MWISKKKYQQLEKKIADLEAQVQGQQRDSKILDRQIQKGIQNYCRDSQRKSSIVEQDAFK